MPAIDSVVLVANTDSAALTPATAVTGDSLVIRSFAPPAKAHFLTMWGTPSNTHPPTVQMTVEVKSPRLHDNVHGIRFQVSTLAGAPIGGPSRPLFVHNPPQPLESQDTLEVDIQNPQNAGATDFDLVLLQNYYENLPGVTARLIGRETLKHRGSHITGVEVRPVTVNANGAWEGGVAINSFFDNLKANKDYALLGGMVIAAGAKNAHAAALRSSDTGNLRVAIPGNPIFAEYSSRWFVFLDEQYGSPPDANGQGEIGMIPVFNASNKGSMITDVSQPDGGAQTYRVIWFFQQLD